MYHSYMLMGSEIDGKRIGALAKRQEYYIRIDAFNENGITEGETEKLRTA